MNETTTASILTQFEPHKPRDRRLQLGLHFARLMRAGKLHLLLPDGSTHDFEGSEPGPAATMVVKDARMVGKLAFGGCLGLAEAYMEGMWDSPHVTDVLALGTANEQAWDNMLRGKAWARFASWLMHNLRPNSRKGSRKNISEHYDLGNDFYAEWLDRSMTYSSALFEGGVDDLQAAQAQKYRRLCESLELKPGMSVLEIGCGWGGFAEMAAGEFGARVTGITLSTEQLAYARQRIARAGLSDKVTLRLQDYRDTSGTFDRIASIEMFEAVGQAYWPTYFRKVRDLLVPGGRAGLQIITIQDQLFDDYARSADFIQKYIFPGGMLPSEARLRQEIGAAGLSWQSVSRFGLDYARTLNQWATRFQGAWKAIEPLGFDERFRRLWLFYLGYCEAGFRTGRTDVIQLGLAKA